MYERKLATNKAVGYAFRVSQRINLIQVESKSCLSGMYYASGLQCKCHCDKCHRDKCYNASVIVTSVIETCVTMQVSL